MRDLKREEIADRLQVREVQVADGHQVGPQRRVPRLQRLSRVQEHQGVRAQGRRHHRDRARGRPPTRSARPAARRCWSSAGASASSSPARAIPTARRRGRSRSASTCPRPNCGGFLTEKRSRRGKVFFGCSNYAKTGCDFVSWDRPVPQKCPQCGAPFLVKRENRRGGGAHALHRRGLRLLARSRPRRAEGGEGGGERPATRRRTPAVDAAVDVQCFAARRDRHRRRAGRLRSGLAARAPRPARLARRAEAGAHVAGAHDAAARPSWSARTRCAPTTPTRRPGCSRRSCGAPARSSSSAPTRRACRRARRSPSTATPSRGW